MAVNSIVFQEQLFYAFGGRSASIFFSSLSTKSEVVINAHFKTVTELRLISFGSNDWLLMLSASEDFSVRAWLLNVDLDHQ